MTELSAPPLQPCVLRILNGPLQGCEFPLGEPRTLFIVAPLDLLGREAHSISVPEDAIFIPLDTGGCNFEVLLAGGANFAALRHLDLTNALAAAGIALANVFDRRVNDNLKVPIGPHNGPHWRQIVFDPATGNIAEQPLNPMPPGMPAGLTEYSLTAITGVPVPLPVAAAQNVMPCAIL